MISWGSLRDGDHSFLRDDVGVHKSPDALLAYELNQLSLKERMEINEEVHGVRDQYHGVKETSQLISESLQKLSVEIEEIRHKPAYEKSQKFPNTWVNTVEFRLIFLRCELFDAQKAAARFIAILELFLEYIGEYALEREIHLSDFSEDERRMMDAGYLQVFPGRDRSGRRILGHFSGDIVQDFADPNNPTEMYIPIRIKVTIYMGLRMVKDDIDVQRRGVVFFFWMHSFRFDDLKVRSFVSKKLIPAIPFRISAMHCYIPVNNQLSHMAKTMFLLAIGPELRSRLRIHTGSTTECLYIVQTYGIHSFLVPIDAKTGERKTDYHEKWLQQQDLKEAYLKRRQEFGGIECPRHADVLFGRGWPTIKHPGNTLYRHVLGQYLDSYNKAGTKALKKEISSSVVFELKESYGSRFLREVKENGVLCWYEASDNLAREKVSVAFRDMRKRKSKIEKKQETNIESKSLPQVTGSINLGSKRVAQGCSETCGASGRGSDSDDTHTTYTFLGNNMCKRQRGGYESETTCWGL